MHTTQLTTYTYRQTFQAYGHHYCMVVRQVLRQKCKNLSVIHTTSGQMLDVLVSLCSRPWWLWLLLLQSSARTPTTWASYVRPSDNGWMSGFLCTLGYGVVVVVAEFRQMSNYVGIIRCMSGFLCSLGYGAVAAVAEYSRLWWCGCCCRVPPEDQLPGHPTYDLWTMARCLGPSIL